MPEERNWSGVIVEKAETAKSFKWTGKTEQGHTNTFWQGKDHKPLPMGEPITITYRETEYARNGEMVKSKWVNGFTALQKTAGPSVAKKDTFPTVREQFIKEVVGGWAHSGNVLPEVEGLVQAIEIAKKAWARTIEAPSAEAPAVAPDTMTPPPPASADDYGTYPE